MAVGRPAAGGPAALRLAAGRARAAELMPYLATALFAMTPVAAPGVGTLGVDRRWRLYWDPTFVTSLDVGECAGAWLHEVGHLLREHADRWEALGEPPARQHRWNQAADVAINADLREARVGLPAGQVWYPELVPGATGDMTTEQVYRLLRELPDQGGPGAPGSPTAVDCGSGAGGPRRAWEIVDGAPGGAGAGRSGVGDPGVGEGRAVLLRQQVAREVAEHRRSRGSVPGGWARWAQDLLEPQVDWRAELRSVVRRSTATVAGLREATYSRPSRRASAVPGVVLPALRQPRPPLVRVVVDTSGSMSQAMLGQCLAEVAALVARVGRGGRDGRGVEVIACDASAAHVQAVREVSAITLVGGGGTDLRVGIDAAAGRRPRADLIITMTDGATPWPSAPPPRDPGARYVAVLVAGEAGAEQVPAWMHTVVVRPQDLLAQP